VLDESVFFIISPSRLPGARARTPSIYMYSVGWVRARVRQDEEERNCFIANFYLSLRQSPLLKEESSIQIQFKAVPKIIFKFKFNSEFCQVELLFKFKFIVRLK
jgi:hypothetical protein